MRTNPIMSISKINPDIRHSFDFISKPKKDIKRITQCFTCKHFKTCTMSEIDEGKDGFCKFYNEVPVDKTVKFINLLNKMEEEKRCLI